jgi:hypothetical protein
MIVTFSTMWLYWLAATLAVAIIAYTNFDKLTIEFHRLFGINIILLVLASLVVLFVLPISIVL